MWAYRDATLMAIRGLAFAEAGRFLEQGLDYAEAREHSHCGHIMASATALVAWSDGRWSEAVERGQHALVDEGSARARSIAQCALGFTAMGRGERGTATAHLEPAAELRTAGGMARGLPPSRVGDGRGRAGRRRRPSRDPAVRGGVDVRTRTPGNGPCSGRSR